MSELEEWITSAEALELLKPLHYSTSTRTICKRAHAGLVKAKAERFVSGSNARDDFEIPEIFWWAEGETALVQNWHAGDFDTWIKQTLHLQAFGVTFWRTDIERLRPKIKTEEKQNLARTASTKIFIGHGQSLLWFKLQQFLEKSLNLETEEFNSVSTAGVAVTERLEAMLDSVGFAFLVATAEDEQSDEKLHARMNVIHEVGLFQGRLGFKKAIIVLEEGCQEFSNIHGLGQIRFASNKIETIFEEIRSVLKRERLIALG